MAEPTIALPKWAEDNVTDSETGLSNVQEPTTSAKNAGWNKGDWMPRQWVNWLARSTYRWLAYLRQENLDRITNIGDETFSRENDVNSVRGDILSQVDGVILESGESGYGNYNAMTADGFAKFIQAIAETPVVVSCKLVGYNSSNVVTVIGPVANVTFMRSGSLKLVHIRIPNGMGMSGAGGTQYAKLLLADGSAIASKYLTVNNSTHHYQLCPAFISFSSSFVRILVSDVDIRFYQAPDQITLNGTVLELSGQTVNYLRV